MNTEDGGPVSASMKDYLDEMFSDGGSAFPTTFRSHPDDYGNEVEVYAPGMSLRDYFAGQALAGLLAEASHPKAPGVGEGDHQRIARDAYRIADAMLKARDED